MTFLIKKKILRTSRNDNIAFQRNCLLQHLLYKSLQIEAMLKRIFNY